MADTLDSIRTAYACTGPALELGALVVGGAAHPDAPVRIPLSMLNRHGLIAGATGTGKTKTLQLIAEQLSDAGVPVFLADIKGDVSGMAAPGAVSDRITARAADTGTTWVAKGFSLRVPGARRARHRRTGTRHRHVLRAGAAQQSAGPERHAGVQPGAGVPLR